MYLAFSAPPRLWHLALLCCVVPGFLLEPFLDCRELGGITVTDKLLFLGAQPFPCRAGVTVAEQFIPIEKVIGRYGFTVELDIGNDASIDLDQNAVQFLCHFLTPPDLNACVARDLRAVQLFSESCDL